MADKSKKNFFQRIGQTFKEVRLELKKSVWPSKDKLKSTSAVVLAVILFFAVFLSLISMGGRWILDKADFYDEVEPTVTETSVAAAVSAEETAQTSQAEAQAEEDTSGSEG